MDGDDVAMERKKFPTAWFWLDLGQWRAICCATRTAKTLMRILAAEPPDKQFEVILSTICGENERKEKVSALIMYHLECRNGGVCVGGVSLRWACVCVGRIRTRVLRPTS